MEDLRSFEVGSGELHRRVSFILSQGVGVNNFRDIPPSRTDHKNRGHSSNTSPFAFKELIRSDFPIVHAEFVARRVRVRAATRLHFDAQLPATFAGLRTPSSPESSPLEASHERAQSRLMYELSALRQKRM
jgi:hypothetical protein